VTVSATDRSDLRIRVGDDMARIRGELERLVRIPSVSFGEFDPADVDASAGATSEILERAGCTGVRLLRVDGAHPAVFAECAAPADVPSVLLYAHHDVQPPGPTESWDSPPFEPSERGGRLFGRGTADDKCGIVAHAAAIRAFGGEPPVAVKVFVEGEEEDGSPKLERFLERYADELRSDVIVLADNPNWRLGVPSLTTSLRGLADCTVELRVLDHAVHSGEFGGPVIDALTCLARLLATLHDDDGGVAVEGLASDPVPTLEMTEDEYRANAGTRPGIRLAGEGPITARLWAEPAISVLGIDAPPVVGASNQIVPFARAMVSVRLAPSDDPVSAMRAVSAHLRSRTPWGAEVGVTEGFQRMGPGARIDTTGPAFDAARRALADAWGTEPVDIGGGGGIPFVVAFAEAFPEASLLLTGAADPDSRLHSENESVDLRELERTCLAEALLLSYL
jgi:acetylornithine deacetylase/succinyl-diaminopimelate desuccinylase-like protein